jgi:hypothetical protein
MQPAKISKYLHLRTEGVLPGIVTHRIDLLPRFRSPLTFTFSARFDFCFSFYWSAAVFISLTKLGCNNPQKFVNPIAPKAQM